MATLVIFVLAAFAVKQISAILMVGSIFKPLRDWFRAYQERSHCSLVNALLFWCCKLIACRLCTTSQVSIWFLGVPMGITISLRVQVITLWGVSPMEWYEYVILAYGCFLASLATAAAAQLLWFVSETFENLSKTAMQSHQPS